MQIQQETCSKMRVYIRPLSLDVHSHMMHTCCPDRWTNNGDGGAYQHQHEESGRTDVCRSRACTARSTMYMCTYQRRGWCWPRRAAPCTGRPCGSPSSCPWRSRGTHRCTPSLAPPVAPTTAAGIPPPFRVCPTTAPWWMRDAHWRLEQEEGEWGGSEWSRGGRKPAVRAVHWWWPTGPLVGVPSRTHVAWPVVHVFHGPTTMTKRESRWPPSCVCADRQGKPVMSRSYSDGWHECTSSVPK